MARYAITMADGSVAIMQTVGEAKPEDCLAKWSPTERAKVVSFQAINPADIPGDRTFRNAWVMNGDKIEHDMAKAREIVRTRRGADLRIDAATTLDELKALAREPVRRP